MSAIWPTPRHVGATGQSGHASSLGLVVVIAALLVCQVVGGANAFATECIYDAPVIARVDVHAFGAAATSPTQIRDDRVDSASPSAEARGTSTTPLVLSNATNTADDLLPGLPAGAPKPAGLGSTGRVTPGNLTEQLAMTEARSGPGGQIIRVTMTDARWPAADGWVKMAQNVNGVEVHYVRNTVTGAIDDFKFAGAG